MGKRREKQIAVFRNSLISFRVPDSSESLHSPENTLSRPVKIVDRISPI
jgi:hypothetical protein